jgi:hypothetical protein
MDNQFMERMTGSSPAELVLQLSDLEGDIGLFAPLIEFTMARAN